MVYVIVSLTINATCAWDSAPRCFGSKYTNVKHLVPVSGLAGASARYNRAVSHGEA